MSKTTTPSAPISTKPISWKSEDDELILSLRFAPSRIIDAQLQATALYRKAEALLGGPTLQVRSWWAEAQQRTQQASRPATGHGGGRSDVATYRVALWAVALFSEIVALDPRDLAALRAVYSPELARTPEARAVMSRSPALTECLSARDARDAEINAAQEGERQRHMAEMPASLLKSFRARGVDLQLAADGSVIAPAGTDMSGVLPSERQQLIDSKADIVAILRAELLANAPGPLVLA